MKWITVTGMDLCHPGLYGEGLEAKWPMGLAWWTGPTVQRNVSSSFLPTCPDLLA